MNKLMVISGPSGSGKGTVVELLKKKYEEENKKLYVSVSCTTREPREGEVDGKSYFFITEQEFEEKLNDHDFLEYNKYANGKYYGTPKSNVVKYLNDGYDVILEIDINGYRQIKENYPDVIGVFITLDDLDKLEERLRNRGTETEEQIQDRMNRAREEIKDKDEYPYVLINYEGKANETMEQIYNILNEISQ